MGMIEAKRTWLIGSNGTRGMMYLQYLQISRNGLLTTINKYMNKSSLALRSNFVAPKWKFKPFIFLNWKAKIGWLIIAKWNLELRDCRSSIRAEWERVEFSTQLGRGGRVNGIEEGVSHPTLIKAQPVHHPPAKSVFYIIMIEFYYLTQHH